MAPIKTWFSKRTASPATVVHGSTPSEQDADEASLPRKATVPSTRPVASVPRSSIEYKMSTIDSGVFMPPSPEKQSYLSRSRSTRSRSETVSMSEQFSISRESFDGYRRSFDIGAVRPVVVGNSPVLEARRASAGPDTSWPVLSSPKIPRELPQPVLENTDTVTGESLDDVDLLDEAQKTTRRGARSRDGQDPRRNKWNPFTRSRPNAPPSAVAPSAPMSTLN